MILGIDTALQNTALVSLSDDGLFVRHSLKVFPKKHPREFVRVDRICEVLNSVELFLNKHPNLPTLVAMEDYILTGHQKAYETAELLGCLKVRFRKLGVPFILVHPSKTHKYVVKRKEVSKTEIIEYVKSNVPGLLISHDAADYSDVADAWVIARIGVLANMFLREFPNYTQVHLLVARSWALNNFWEERWIELMFTDGSGILTKPGLYVGGVHG